MFRSQYPTMETKAAHDGRCDAFVCRGELVNCERIAQLPPSPAQRAVSHAGDDVLTHDLDDCADSEDAERDHEPPNVHGEQIHPVQRRHRDYRAGLGVENLDCAHNVLLHETSSRLTNTE